MEVLKQKEREAIAALVIPSGEEITTIVDAEFGLTEKRERLGKLKAQIEDVLSELNEATGENRHISFNSSYRERSPKSAYAEREKDLRNDLREQPVADIKRVFEQKRTQLWLCETLEDAKAIVGI